MDVIISVEGTLVEGIYIWVSNLEVLLGLCLEVGGVMVLGGVSSDAFSSFKTSIVLHVVIAVLRGPIRNGLNPSPKLGGCPFVVIGLMIPCF